MLHSELRLKRNILLSTKLQFAKLLCLRKHINLMHADQQLLLASIREKDWPLGGRSLARKSFSRLC